VEREIVDMKVQETYLGHGLCEPAAPEERLYGLQHLVHLVSVKVWMFSTIFRFHTLV
jgi:hypothetical protein